MNEWRDVEQENHLVACQFWISGNDTGSKSSCIT